MQNSKSLIIGGGCFWCTEAMFLTLKGIISVVSGYSGGHVVNPTYKEVCSGDTGHAECIEIRYSPLVINMEDLIAIHLLSHDPTTLNRQGNDIGSQYRSVIFYENESDKNLIKSILHKMQSEFDRPIVTSLEALSPFYPAEDYHQNYYELNKVTNPYCELISIKLKKFLDKFQDRIK